MATSVKVQQPRIWPPDTHGTGVPIAFHALNQTTGDQPSLPNPTTAYHHNHNHNHHPIPPKQPQNAPTRAPWRAAFLEHLSLTPSPTFTLATLHPAAAAATAAAAAAPLPPPSPSPRARTCVFRGLWASGLPGNNNNNTTRNPAPLNPPGVYESDLPVFTTDARSGKVGELGVGVGAAAAAAAVGDGGGEGGGKEERMMTGGGGTVEAVFWVGDPKVRTQWRVRGSAWVLAGDVDGDGEGARVVRGVLEGRMRRVGDEGGDGGGDRDRRWSFAREVTAHFGNLSPLMRGSFRAPPPGTPLAAYHAGKGEELGQRVDDVEDEAARRNFRVVVIVPEEVDQVDLRDELRPRRWLYVYRGVDGVSKLPGGEIIGEWEKVEVWP
ncbi:hypothetical protein B0I37DRAFT_426254 [Chaetomium sp. MPI-CAGE-AT-0009]|nr:hypothetical protein B0I37DRAFT_426254 [Chaetomium sp. MPI-CAGE-AT-0009]